jgi:hypothetical protein
MTNYSCEFDSEFSQKNMSHTISTNNLNGIRQALNTYKPELIPTLEMILSDGATDDPSVSPHWVRGASESPTFTAAVLPEDGGAALICQALKEINRNANGEILLFGELTMDGLIMAWNNFASGIPPA